MQLEALQKRSVTSDETAREAASCRAKKLEREMKKLSWDSGKGKPAMNKAAVIEFDKDGNETGEKEIHFVFNSELMTECGEPKTFWDAAARDGEEGEHWLQASGSECMTLVKRGSWRKKLRSEVKNEGRKIIGAKWVHKRKDEQDGSVRHKGRIVSLGCMQIPGVDHTESFSPVGNDTSVRIVIGLSLFNDDWVLEIIDVEAAFLEGDVEKTMPMEWPAGMVHLGFITEEEENCCIEQLKSVCGNSDAALICFRLFKKHLIEVMEMKQSLADPCVFFKLTEVKVALVAVCHVDDNAIAGAPHWIKWFKEGVKKRFGVTELGLLKKHLGVWYEWKMDEHGERHVVAMMP
jgi:hypothetical protein